MNKTTTNITVMEKENANQSTQEESFPVDCEVGLQNKWKPAKGRKYYWLSSSTSIRSFYALLHKEIWTDSEFDEALYKQGNCFKSIKEAKFTYESFGGHW